MNFGTGTLPRVLAPYDAPLVDGRKAAFRRGGTPGQAVACRWVLSPGPAASALAAFRDQPSDMRVNGLFAEDDVDVEKAGEIGIGRQTRDALSQVTVMKSIDIQCIRVEPVTSMEVMNEAE